MKKILYILILTVLMLSALTTTVKASFFNDLLNLIRGIKPYNSSDINQAITQDTNENLVINDVCFNQELEIGNENQDVKNLQQFLCDSKFYPKCLITGYFGSLTKGAVMNFQNYYSNEILKPLGLVKATGYVGQATLKKLNSLFGCSEATSNTNIITFNNSNVFESTKPIPEDTTTDIVIPLPVVSEPIVDDSDNDSACIINSFYSVGNQKCSSNSDCKVVDNYCVNSSNTSYTGIWDKTYTKVSKSICSDPNVNLPFIDQGDRCECVDSGTCEVLSDNDKAIICGNGLCEGTENRQLLYRWAEKRIINGQSILYPVSPEENEYYCEKDCAKQTISSTPRYSCSNGQCVTNPNGAFLTNNCNNMCVASRKYACNNSGVCVLTTGGPYTTSNCDNECIPSTMKLLEEIYYDKAKIQGRCAYTQEITGDFHYATLSEDKQFYPALKIKSPISYKSYLTLNTRNFPQDPVDKCCDFGWIKICLEGAFLRHSGFELISNIEDLKKYFTVSDISIFEGDFFDKNILVFPYYYLWEDDFECKLMITDFKVDRVIYDAPDFDEIHATNDTTPYNYRLPKYYQVILKVGIKEIVDNNKVCALKCQSGPKYMFDVVAISKEDLKKADGNYKKVIVDNEVDMKTCSLIK